MPPWQAQFWPQGHNLNKLDSGLLGDDTYLISRLDSLWFQTRRINHVSLMKAYVKYVTPGAGPYLA